MLFEILMEDPEFTVKTLVTETAEMIVGLTAEQNLSKADLARRLNQPRAWVTRLLNDEANMTVRNMAEAAYALREHPCPNGSLEDIRKAPGTPGRAKAHRLSPPWHNRGSCRLANGRFTGSASPLCTPSLLKTA